MKQRKWIILRIACHEFLCEGEYSNAEQLLIYPASIESKKVLIKVYREWLEVGNFNEAEISQLTKRIRGLEIECAEKEMHERTSSTNSVASAVSGGDTVTPPILPSFRRILVDACANTPNRVDTQNVPGVPAFANSPFSPANISAVDECTEHFCNDLMIKMYRKQLGRVGKKPLGKEAPLEDLGELQKHVAQIDRAQHEVECADPVNLIRGLLLPSNAAESADSSKLVAFTDRAIFAGNGIFKPAPEIIRKSSQEECSK